VKTVSSLRERAMGSPISCSVPCDHVPVRSWPLFRAREVMREVIASLKQEQKS
jgi:hypothetical protein